MTHASEIPNAAPGRLVLASRSPRRRALLDEHGLSHEAAHPGFEDSELERGPVPPDQWIASLAYLKAWAKAADSDLPAGSMVLGADTACLMDNELIGTPADAAEAEAMIRRFIDAEHEVLTGVAVVEVRPFAAGGPLDRECFIDRAKVRLGHLSNEQIGSYIASGEWSGKAGGYNYRERVEAGWPLSHEGDATTIMGLPMNLLTGRLFKLLGRRTSVVTSLIRPDQFITGAVA
jgi:septum formation protein